MRTWLADGWVGPMDTKAPAALFTTITATAPLFCAFSTFSEKLQVPRSISAIFPLRSVEMLPQPRVAPFASVTDWTVPVRPQEYGPNEAISAA